MRAIAALVLLWPLWVGAAVKFIDLSGAGILNADGSDVNNQCAGVGDADCIGGNLPAGSTAYLCGAATSTTANPVAGSAGNVTTYDCSCPGGTAGSIAVSSGIAWIHNKAYTDVRNCTFSSAGETTSDRGIAMNANNISATNNTITQAGRGIEITTAATRDDIVISGNTLSNIYLNPIVWAYSCANQYNLTDITITGNTITASGLADSDPHAINLQYTGNTASCVMQRITITDNVIDGQSGNAISVDHVTDAVTNEDITVTGNTCNNSDGCIAVHSFGSSTSGYGKNIIANNICTNLVGDTGCVDLFYSEYVDVYGNRCADLSTSNIDGNCILVDTGNDGVRVYRNSGYNLTGISSAENSGIGVMVLSSVNVDIFANIFWDVKSGFWFSGGGTESGVNVHHNTMARASLYGARVMAAHDASSLTFQQNVIYGAPVGISAAAGGNTQTVDNNTVVSDTTLDVNENFTPTNTSTADPLFVGGSNPTTAEGFKTRANSPLRGAGTYVDGAYDDYSGRRYKYPPSIGAYEATSGFEADTRTLRD